MKTQENSNSAQQSASKMDDAGRSVTERQPGQKEDTSGQEQNQTLKDAHSIGYGRSGSGLQESDEAADE